MNANGSSIDYTCSFEGQPCFPHGIKGIFISGDALFGRNCIIFQQVTVGSNYLLGSKHPGAPRIGRNCIIGAGARIIGGITVGDNCRIGAGCVVFEDVPPASTIVCGASRLIRHAEPLENRYYSRKGGAWFYYADGAWVKEVREHCLQYLDGARKHA